VLTKAQLDDLASLQVTAGTFAAAVVIIGAAALGCFIDIERFTMDIDLVVALDLDEFAIFAVELQARGWNKDPQREHRWHGPAGSITDLLPAGPALREARRLVWRVSGFEMSLVGFEHVFTQARPFSFADGSRCQVASPPVLALLKIVAFMDDPYGRGKDLLDLRMLFRAYEKDSDRIFDDDVLAAELEDVEYAGAYLLGQDVGSLVTDEEMGIVRRFLRRELMPDEELDELNRADNWAAVRVQQQLRAFHKGLGHGGASPDV
jgi:predicted nucleotidyltransferase